MTSIQNFDSKTEASEVISAFASSIKGKTILITGVNPNGLGATLAHNLASQHPAHLILTGRTLSKVHTVCSALAAEHPNVLTHSLNLDLSSFVSIRNAAREINDATQWPSIDILINNAGVMNVPSRELSADGFELHLATNYLGAFLFTTSIVDKIAASGGGGRVVNVGSNGYVLSPFRFSDYNFDGGKPLPDEEQASKQLCEKFGVPWSSGYSPAVAYGQSKTAMLLFTVQLAKLYGERGVTAFCVHPGAIATDLWRHMPQENTEQVFTAMSMKTPSQGASTILVAALDPRLSGSSGAYLADCQIESVMGFASDGAKAERLWRLSVELVG